MQSDETSSVTNSDIRIVEKTIEITDEKGVIKRHVERVSVDVSQYPSKVAPLDEGTIGRIINVVL